MVDDVDGRDDSVADDVGLLDFEAEFSRLWVLAQRAGHRLLGDREAAEDVAAEALARAYERWDGLTGRGDPAPWVTRVAVNLALDRARSMARHPNSSLDPAQVPSVPDPHLAERLTLSRALRKLPARQREAVALRYVCDISEADTSHFMGCSAGAVKQHASRGLARLRRDLEPEEAL